MTHPPCAVDGCPSTVLAKGLCNTHYLRVKKHGDPHRVDPGGRPTKGERPSWTAIHKRIDRTRGKATGFVCIDCTGPAREWSYDNADPNELVDRTRRWPLRYSLDLAHYAPRCTPCHRRFDRKAATA